MSRSEFISCILFHGPTAQGRAAEAATNWGRVVGTFGDPTDGLDVATVRAAVEALSSPPVGDRKGAVIVGPVDVVTQEGVVDVLLKTLEEFDPRGSRPYLWAWDVGSVRPTIRSRCLMEWCPGRFPVDSEAMEAAKAAVSASLTGSVAGVVEAFAAVEDGWKDMGDAFLRGAAEDLSRREGTKHLGLWERVRDLLRVHDTPSFHEAVTGFLP